MNMIQSQENADKVSEGESVKRRLKDYYLINLEFNSSCVSEGESVKRRLKVIIKALEVKRVDICFRRRIRKKEVERYSAHSYYSPHVTKFQKENP